MEATRQLKLKQKDEREKSRFVKHLHRTSSNPYAGPSSNIVDVAGNYEVTVHGIKFLVAKGGSKLVKVPGESSELGPVMEVEYDEVIVGLRFIGDGIAPKNTPKMAMVGGVKFVRSTSGNMYRSGIVKAHRYGPSNSRPDRSRCPSLSVLTY